jgi:hypothetical protein
MNYALRFGVSFPCMAPPRCLYKPVFYPRLPSSLPSFSIFSLPVPLNFSLRHSTRYLTGSQYTRCAIYVISLFLHPVFTNTILVESDDFSLNLDLRPPLNDRFSPLTIALVDNAQLLYLSAPDRFFLLLGRRVRLPCWLGLWLDEKNGCSPASNGG